MPTNTRHAKRSDKPSSQKSPYKTRTLSQVRTLSQIRIIAGEYRRRLVSFIEAEGLRPTPDRLRETLFNWLNHELPNSRVLDCCAGSGILGLEALSRGARHVTMIEPNQAQFAQIQATIAQLNISSDKITAILATAQQAIPTQPQAFDVIFLDPPYSLDLWSTLLTLLHAHGLIHTQTLIYIEADKPPLELNLPSLNLYKETRVGQIYAGLYRWQSV